MLVTWIGWTVRAPLSAATAWALLVLVTGAIVQPASAQVWRDAANGEVVPSGPIFHEPQATFTGVIIGTRGVIPEPANPSRAFDPVTGRNFVFDSRRCVWKDAANGEVVPSGPIFHEPQATFTGVIIGTRGVIPEPANPSRAFDAVTGRNFVRTSCRPAQTVPTPTLPQGSATIKLSGEVGWGGSRNGFEDFNFNGSGIIGGVSGQFNFPISAGTYAGLGVSVLGSGISGNTPDPITSNIQLLVPIDGIVGMTFMQSGFWWPVSVSGFGGLAIGSINISAPPFSTTQTMTGWSAGIGVDLEISPTWSVGVKYRHFDLGNANFSVFPGGTSLITERGDMVTGIVSYRFPLSLFQPISPIVTK